MWRGGERGSFGGDLGPSVWLVPLVCAGVYLLVGQSLATHGIFGTEFDNCVFEADGPRIVENSTTLKSAQWRTRIHPLHGLLTVPLGAPLALVLPSPAHAASLVVSLLAGLTLVASSLVLKRAGLGNLDRNLFVALLGSSATMATFGAVPEVHVLSGLGLTLMALSFFPRQDRTVPRPGGGEERTAWLRALPGMFVAVGAQLTSLALVPLCVLLHLPRGSLPQRLSRAVLLSIGFALSVAALHGVQRSFRTEPSLAANVAQAPDDGGAPGTAQGAAPRMGVVDSHLLFVTRPAALPARVLETAVAVVGAGLVAPELRVGTREGQPSVGFRYWPPSFRPLGAVAFALWLALAASVTSLAARRKGLGRIFRERPGALLAVLSTGLYFLVFCLYGDELFLFSPNWLPPLILTVGVLYSSARSSSDRSAWRLRSLLMATVAFVCVNTFLHLRDLLELYT